MLVCNDDKHTLLLFINESEDFDLSGLIQNNVEIVFPTLFQIFFIEMYT